MRHCWATIVLMAICIVFNYRLVLAEAAIFDHASPTILREYPVTINYAESIAERIETLQSSRYPYCISNYHEEDMLTEYFFPSDDDGIDGISNITIILIRFNRPLRYQDLANAFNDLKLNIRPASLSELFAYGAAYRRHEKSIILGIGSVYHSSSDNIFIPFLSYYGFYGPRLAGVQNLSHNAVIDKNTWFAAVVKK